jgi:hypothetical protein
VIVWNRETNVRLTTFKISSSPPQTPLLSQNKKAITDARTTEHVTSLIFLNEQSDSSLLLVASDDGIVRAFSGFVLFFPYHSQTLTNFSFKFLQKI